MGAKKRQMHLGVFVLGTGNHSAGWRWEGAATSHMQLPVIQEIARIAERGKFDLLFISNSMVMDPGDHPSFLCRFEPTTLITALAALHDPYRPRRDRLDQLLGAVQRRPHLRLDRPYQQRARRLERRHDRQPESRAEFRPRRAPRTRIALRARQRVRRCRQGSVGLLGGRRDRRRQGDRPLYRSRQGPSARTTRGASSRSRGR